MNPPTTTRRCRLVQTALFLLSFFTFTTMAHAVVGVPLNIKCPTNITVWSCNPEVRVQYPPPEVSGGCREFNVVCQPPSGSVFPLGVTIVTCRVIDCFQSSDTCRFTVTVLRDTEPPVIQCPSNRVVRACPTPTGLCGTVINYPAPLASDNSGFVSVVCNPPSGSFFPCGVNTVTCRAEDRCGNKDECSFIIRVEPGQAPGIQCPVDLTLFTCSNSAVVVYPAPVVNPAGTAVLCFPPSGSSMTLGSHAVTCIASNQCGTATCSFKVDVRPIRPPSIVCPTNPIVVTVPCGTNCVPVTYPAPTVSNGSLAGCSPAPGTCLPVGLHLVTCVATNICGDRAVCEFQVRVIQSQGQPPIIRCPQDMVVVACSNECAVVHYPAPLVVNGSLVKCDPPSGSCLPPGVHTIRCEASNACATVECKFTVTVLKDDPRPKLTIKRDGRFVIICWPKTCACYKLQSTRSLNPPIIWTDVAATPDDSFDSWCVRLPIEARHRFFRLIKCDQPTAPVFTVTGVGITAGQAILLAGALDIPRGELHYEGGQLLFMDPLKFQAIPTKPIQDAELIAELRRGSEMDGNSELSFKGIDFEGVKQLRVLDDAKALDVWEHAFRQAGIEPGSGEPVVRHTTFDAVDPNGRPMVEETMIDTHVFFQFDLGGRQLIGPGANLRVAFGPGGAPTALQGAFRQLKQEGETPILSLDEAARRCAALYPNLKGNIRPQLAYYAPSLLLPAVQKILPCYICGGDASVDGERVNLLQSIIAASEDPALTPSVALEASAQRSLVNAKATPTGGTAPYTYQWSSSSTDLGGIPSDASSIEYVATPRADESGETVRVIVTDANGIQVQASKTVEVTGAGPSMIFTAAVGGVSDYGTERGVSDLCAAQQTAFNARFALDGYTRRFNWAASTAWERDFKQGGTGLDHLYVDNVDITFYMGHGSGQGFTFENNHDDTLLRYSDAVGAWGNNDLEFLAMLSCSVMADTYGGLNWAQRWGPTFDGLHLLLGFENTAYDEAGFGNAFAQWMLGYRFGFITLPPVPVRSAWFMAKDGNQPSSVIAVTMGVVGPSGISNYDDYFWGKGPVGPDVRGANIHGYWRVRHP